jgi:hypothetical protein
MIRSSSDRWISVRVVTLTQKPHRIGRERENASPVANPAEEHAGEERQPAAHGALGYPDRSEEASGKRKNACTPGPAASELGESNGSDDECRQNFPPTGYHENRRAGKNGQLQEESDRPSHLVVGLADALGPEVSGAGRPAQHVGIEKDGLAAARGKDGAYQLEILEHRVAVVTSCRDQRRSAHAERAWPVAARHPIDKHSPRVPACVPGQRIEVVLRPHDIDITERVRDTHQRGTVVANVIVRKNEPLVPGETNSSEHISNLPHRRDKSRLGRHVAYDPSPARGVGAEYFRRGRIHDQNLVSVRREPSQVVGPLRRQNWLGRLYREDVGDI